MTRSFVRDRFSLHSGNGDCLDNRITGANYVNAPNETEQILSHMTFIDFARLTGYKGPSQEYAQNTEDINALRYYRQAFSNADDVVAMDGYDQYMNKHDGTRPSKEYSNEALKHCKTIDRTSISPDLVPDSKYLPKHPLSKTGDIPMQAMAYWALTKKYGW